MKKNFVKPSMSIDVFNMEHILLTSGVAPEKTNIEAANEAFNASVVTIKDIVTISL